MLGPKPERLRRVARRTKAAPRATTRSGTHEGALSFCFFQSQTRRDQDVASFRQDLGSATSYIHYSPSMETWTPTTARVQVELDRLDKHFQTLSNNGVYAGIEELVLEIRRKECSNWCQRITEWLYEEIRMFPKRRTNALSGPVRLLRWEGSVNVFLHQARC